MKLGNRRFCVALGAVAILVATMVAPAAASTNQSALSREPVSWWWDHDDTVGRSNLVRTPNGLRAAVRSTGLTPGDAVTLWFIVFNNPEACSTSPCSVPADVFNSDTEADFFWGDGRVVGAKGSATFAGSLGVGQTAHSGKVEIGAGDAVPLTNPRGAEVVLALHSHGPAATGDLLAAQLGSYTGGCEVFNGPDGFAAGPADIPDAFGECSTLQGALHR